MHPQIGFPAFLILTVLLLALTVGTGLKARRKQHFLLVALTVVALTITIYFAEVLGTTLDLESSGRAYPIHIVNAQVAVACFLAALCTGLFHYKTGQGRRVHFWCAMVATSLMVLAAGTGVVMWLLSKPLPG